MSNKTTYIIAGILLAIMSFTAVFSMKNDSLTMDELAHTPAGYSYLTQKDMRLNPEHPPLIKDLAASPLLFIKNIHFPSNIESWKEDVNGQWKFGNNFLFHSDNPTDKIIFWSRIPMVLILILLGFYIFLWAKELLGNKGGLLSLFLFSFSPTFIAHGRLVTTDVGAAAGIFIATYYFIKALKKPCKKNIILAGVSFGIAQLCKFSVILLGPLFIFLALVWWVCQKKELFNFKNLTKILGSLILVFLIGFLLIGVVYQYHVWNYPPERQAQDIEFLLDTHPWQFLKPLLSQTAQVPILRAYTQYFLGLAMIFERAGGGNTTYFLGEVSNIGWKNYFPFVYAVKVPLAFHILTLIALFYTAWLIRKPFWQNAFQRIREWIKNHFAYFAMIAFIALYWTTSLSSNLNIGVRHLLPIFALNIILVSAVITKWLKEPFLKAKYAILGILLLWQSVSVLSVYPHFLSYFNELVGGPEKGYIYTVDSNLDWGQDLKRLDQWTNEKGINKIYVDYFGGADVEYYLKEKFLPWWGTRDPGELEKGDYLAVSATLLQGGRGELSPGFNQTAGFYRWLYKYEPIEKIGHSIFVYHIK